MSLTGSELKEVEEKLRQQAAAWIDEKLPERMQSVGVTKDDVRKQLEIEADNWVQWNLEQQKEGKPGTDSPDAGIKDSHDLTNKFKPERPY
jgi:hypothetical protein